MFTVRGMIHPITRILAGTLVVAALVGITAAGIAVGPSEAAAHGSPRTKTWPPLGTAGSFLLGSIKDKVEGRWGAAWRSLYPFHQHVVSRSAFVGCELTTPFAAPLQSMSIARLRRAPVHVPGLTHPVAGVAVTMHVELTWYGPRDPITLSPTFHLVPVRGHWTWLLSAERYRFYTHGGCGNPPGAVGVTETVSVAYAP